MLVFEKNYGKQFSTIQKTEARLLHKNIIVTDFYVFGNFRERLTTIFINSCKSKIIYSEIYEKQFNYNFRSGFQVEYLG